MRNAIATSAVRRHVATPVVLGALLTGLIWLGSGCASAPKPPGSVAATPAEIAKNRKNLERKMEKIRIPEIDFQNVTLKDAVQFLVQASRAYDKGWSPSPGQGVNLVLDLREMHAPAEAAKRFGAGVEAANGILINFQAQKISLLQALKNVARLAGLQYRLENDFVLIGWGLDARDPMELRSYPLDLSGIEKVKTVAQMVALKALPAAAGLNPEDKANDLLKIMLDKLGMTFPPGSSVYYTPATLDGIVLANTADNLVKFEQILAQVYPEWRTEHKLRTIELPKIAWKERPLPEAVTELVELSRKYDKSPERKLGVNAVLKVSDDTKKLRITFRARAVTLKEALEAVLMAANLKYKIKGDVVVVYAESTLRR